ncbi:Transposase DDE domain protein [compost metagenome]
MHQTKKGKQWYFGMKAHIGADAESGLVHSAVGTAANVADVTQVGQLLHGEENVVCADAGYTGVEKRPEHEARQVIWQVAARRSIYQQLGKRSALYKAKRKIEKAKAQVPQPRLAGNELSREMLEILAMGQPMVASVTNLGLPRSQVPAYALNQSPHTNQELHYAAQRRISRYPRYSGRDD